ncbi:MAG: four helix bundle protein [Candidatus Shapirobacteria bacterium]
MIGNKLVDFYDLEAWKEGHKLALLVYGMVSKLPSDEKYGLSDQLRRASASVTANIAEGFGRFHFNDKIHFFYLSRGSVKEVQSFLLLGRDLKYLSVVDVNIVWTQSKSAEKLINGLIRSTEKQK